MAAGRPQNESVSTGTQDLEARLVALGNTVESLFADSVVVLMDSSLAVASQLRQEDYKAHDQWVEIDKLCVESLVQNRLEPRQVRFIITAMKTAAALKRIADESLRIGEGIRSCGAVQTSQGGAVQTVARMVELAQGMLNEVLTALSTQAVAQPSDLHEAFRELASLSGQAGQEIGPKVQQGLLAVPSATALLSAAQRLERVADTVLEVSSHVHRLRRPDQP